MRLILASPLTIIYIQYYRYNDITFPISVNLLSTLFFLQRESIIFVKYIVISEVVLNRNIKLWPPY